MPFNPDSPAGIDGFKKTIEAYSTIFSQFNFDFQGIYVDGDKLIVRHIATAIHSGEFLGIKPTDKLVTWHSIDIYTVKDNKMIEGWHVESFLKTYLDMLSNN
jgi:predicted ester cyclase